MSWYKVSLVDLDRGTTPRIAWADIAKAISIVLLVLWTTVGDRVYVNEMLIFLRMPLFFFVSGLFAHRVITRTDLVPFLRDKVGNLMYLYALWVGLLFASTSLVAHVVLGRSMNVARQFELLWNPVLTMWFLYALAVAFLVAWCLRRVPVWIVAAGAFALYWLSVSSGDWRWLPFPERVIRLFPFFWIGLVTMSLAARLVERFHLAWPVAAALFLALSYAVFDSTLNANGPLTLAISLVGIAAVLMLSRHLSAYAWSRPLAIVGGSTLYIYVMQRVVLFYFEEAQRVFDIAFTGLDVVNALAIVVICTVVGRWLAAGGWTAWMFRAPWIDAQPARPQEELARA
jgi:uncharacterized membrane protein YcfT